MLFFFAQERIVGTLLHKQIALYCPHTAWDCVEGGVNDWLAGAFGKPLLILIKIK